MAQLGELLSGMLTDVVRARMAADAATAQAVESYRNDAALASMSVPRVTISTLTVKLNFAVSGVVSAERVQVEGKTASEDWGAAVAARIAPLLPPPKAPTSRAAKAAPGARTDPPLAQPISVSVRPETIRSVLDDARAEGAVLESRVQPLVEATVEEVVKGSSSKITAELRDQLNVEIRKEALVFTDTLLRRELLDQALRSRLEVDIVADKVSETKPQALQSLEVTFGVDDLEELLPPASEWR